MDHTFHQGELTVQKRAGVLDVAGQVGNGIRNYVPPIGKEFLEQQRFAILGTIANDGSVWASLVMGYRGFMRVVDSNVIDIGALPPPPDPLGNNLKTNGNFGMIAIEFSSRRRMRINGQAKLTAGGIHLVADEVYSNCPKYIQARELAIPEARLTEYQSKTRTSLAPHQVELMFQSNTFFIASAHPERGVDVSHRGGRPGFVHVDAPTLVVFPDYSGNRMFNTLGNISVNSHVGLLFIDFTTGGTLQLAGRARILWEHDRMDEFPGAERLVEFEISRVVETRPVNPIRWVFLGNSPFLPS